MADKKRKIQGGQQSNRKQHKSGSSSKKMKKSDKHKGPRLPNSLRKELESLNQRSSLHSEEDDDVIDSDEEERGFKDDVYEYEEEVPEEESRKNRRFDPVENLEYELPEEFEDENVESDDDEDGSGDEEEDDGRHSRMLHQITGIPGKAFEGKKRRKNAVVSEVYPESEFNPSDDVLEGDGRINIQDLLEPLEGKVNNETKRRMHKLERNAPMQAPLSKSDREKIERKAVYEKSKKEISRWEPLIKRNREASTLIFDKDIDINFSTVGAIASEFEPRTDFEKKIASLVSDEKIVEAHMKDGARLLELNKVSVEDEKERHERNAKIRSLLFHHELKNKRIKKIKSKTYHRLSKKDKARALSAQLEDPEVAKELARKEEFKRVEERLTLKHKNTSKWAKRILQRGLDTQDEGTRAAIAEQLQQHTLLARKQNSMKDSSSSDDRSSDEDDSDGSDQEDPVKLLTKAQEKTLKVLEKDGDDGIPASGVLSLPFMVRGMKKRNEAAVEEAKLALQDYENSLKQIEGSDLEETENPVASARSGRMVFGAVKPQPMPSGKKGRSKREFDGSDDEDVFEVKEDDDTVNQNENGLHNGPAISFDETSEEPQHSVFQNLDSIVKNPGSKTTYDVSIFASDSWRKMNEGKKDGKQVEASSKKKQQAAASPAPNNKEANEPGEDSDTDSDKEMMVDGILSAGGTYELPSQADLVRSAFAGDDVEEDFEKDKMDILNKENPEPEKPVLLPGWGQWTNVQKKKGLPSWIVQANEAAKKQREEALKKRKDARFKHVIISEKVDQKTEKLHTTTLPFPFTSKEVFERSNRMPIGPEFNPATAIGALTRPEVLKRPGINIKPIKFEEVNTHEERGEHSKDRNNKSKKNTKGGVKPGANKKKVVKVKS